jgi:hypothetical protein
MIPGTRVAALLIMTRRSFRGIFRIKPPHWVSLFSLILLSATACTVGSGEEPIPASEQAGIAASEPAPASWQRIRAIFTDVESGTSHDPSLAEKFTDSPAFSAQTPPPCLTQQVLIESNGAYLLDSACQGADREFSGQLSPTELQALTDQLNAVALHLDRLECVQANPFPELPTLELTLSDGSSARILDSDAGKKQLCYRGDPESALILGANLDSSVSWRRLVPRSQS